MKILIIHPHIGNGQTKTPDTKRYFPWGLATVAKCLETAGHEILIFDIYAKDYMPDQVEQFLEEKKFDIACISGFSSMNYSYIVWLADIIKKRKSSLVIIGGLLSDLHYNLLLTKKTIDICVISEGEETIVDLIKNINNLENVKGIAFKKNNKIYKTEKRELIKNLDSLPMPNFKLWDMDIYTKSNMWANDRTTRYDEYDSSLPCIEKMTPNISIFSGRGCPYKCTFCSRSYNTLRMKSITKIIEEINFFINEYNIKAFHFWDELLIINKKRTIEFCNAIKKLNVYWDCQARVNTVDKESLQAMKDANCVSVGLGLESGSDKILSAMKKNITKNQSLKVLKEAKEIGLHLKLQFMYGYPGDNSETLKETISLIKKSSYPPRRLLCLTPLPGSELYIKAIEDGLIKDEEAYIKQLSLGMNLPPNRILLNISGQSNDELTRLYFWVHMKLEINYILSLLYKNLYKMTKNILFDFLNKCENDYSVLFGKQRVFKKNIPILDAIILWFKIYKPNSYKRNDAVKKIILYNLSKKIPDIIKKCKNLNIKEIYIFGAGTHTEILLSIWKKYNAPIVKGIIVSKDKNINEFCNIPVLNLREVDKKQVKTIILSSHTYEKEMKNLCEIFLKNIPVYSIYES